MLLFFLRVMRVLLKVGLVLLLVMVFIFFSCWVMLVLKVGVKLLFLILLNCG